MHIFQGTPLFDCTISNDYLDETPTCTYAVDCAANENTCTDLSNDEPDNIAFEVNEFESADSKKKYLSHKNLWNRYFN